jgi:hypothetical protein
MRKTIISILVLAFIASCTNDAPLNKVEEQVVDSFVNNEQAASDSLMKAIQAEIDSDSTLEENQE